MIYHMVNDEKRMGRPGPWDSILGKVCRGGTEFPAPIWELLRTPETKITLNEMAINDDFKKEIQRMGAEQKAKRLSGTNEKTPSARRG